MAAAWRDPDFSQDTAKSACAVLRDLPARPTQRTCKTSSDLERASAVLDQGVFEGAADEQEHQLHAFQETWHDIDTTLKELQHHTLAPVFSQLQQWVAATSAPNSTQEAAPAATAAMAGQLLPTVALSVASSTNTAETYAQLIVTLKQKGHPVALITSRETCAGLASVVGSAMRQFTGGPTPADDVPALAAWWEDQRQRHYGSSSSRADGSAPATGVQGSRAASAAAAATPSRRGAEAAAADAATPPATGRRAAAAASTPSTAVRELRARPQRTPGQHGGKTPGAGPVAGAAAGPALQAPVLLLQEADGGDMESLGELVLALGEARRAGLPLVLVLGITSSHAGLLQLLPNSLLRRVQLLLLALPPSRQQLALLTRSVLLKGPLPRLVLGPRTAAWLLQHFRDVDCSASTAERTLQLACVEHFMQQPLSCLGPAAASGQRSSLAAAVAQLPQRQLLRCCSSLLAELQEAVAASAAGGTCAAVTAVGAAARASPPAAKLSRLSSVSSPGGAAAAAAASSSPHLPSVTAAMSQLQALVQLGGAPGRTSPGSAAPVVAAAAGVLEQAVWAAVQAFARWRLGVLLLSGVAAFTGASEQDASLQLPAVYAAASQPSFMTVSHRGALSPCGLLLLKLLGSCTSAAGAGSSGGGGSDGGSRARVVTVEQLPDGEAAQLLQKLAGLLQGLQPRKQQQPKKSRRGAAGHRGSRQAESDSSSSSSSSESDSQDESDSDSDDAAAEAAAAAEQDTALFSCADVQHLQQALAALTAATTAAGSSSSQPLSAFTQQFQQLLAPLPELLRPAAAAAGVAARDARSAAGGDVCTPSDATMTGTPCLKSLRGKAAGAAAPDTLTPGGLVSRLRRQVRFAPGTPDHGGPGQADAAAAAAAAGYLGGSVQSTPEAAAVAGHIKTPSKRGSGGSKPKKKLFDPAALAAAAADADGRRRKAKKGDKHKETGEIAGSSAAALAAVAAAAATAPGLGRSPVVGKAVVTGNKRSERLLQLMTATAGGGGGGKGVPGPAAARQGLPSGLNTPPAHRPGAAAGGPAAGAAGAGAVSPRTPLSPRGEASAARRAGTTAGAGDSSVQGTPAAGDMITSPARPGRSNSRLSRRSEPAASTDGYDAAAAGLAAMDSTPTQKQQQQQLEGMQVDAAASAGHEQPQDAVMTLGAVLARLLRAVIPKLLLEWSCPTSSSGAGSSSAVDATLAAAGAAAFTFDDVAVLSSQLCPAPRVAVHAALVAPSHRLPGHPQHPGPSWEDTCLAYLLLQQQREDSLAVSDWFGLFCQAQRLTGFSADDGRTDEDGDMEAAGAGGVGTGRAVRARARAGRKAKGFAEARADGGAGGSEGGDVPASSSRSRRGAADQGPAAAAAAAAAGTPGKKGRTGTATTPATGSKRGGRKAAAAAAAMDDSDEAAAVDEQQLLEAAARFSQAAAELQLLGVWKATKRRRLAAVQRVFAPESYAAVLAEGADGAEWESVPDHEYEM